MEEQHKFFIKYSLEKAKNTLLEADFNFQNGFYGIVVNRVYYGIFYAITALGYLENLKTAKHHQLLGWFNKTFIYEKFLIQN